MVSKMTYHFSVNISKFEKVLGKSSKYHGQAKSEEKLKTSTRLIVTQKECSEKGNHRNENANI